MHVLLRITVCAHVPRSTACGTGHMAMTIASRVFVCLSVCFIARIYALYSESRIIDNSRHPYTNHMVN